MKRNIIIGVVAFLVFASAGITFAITMTPQEFKEATTPMPPIRVGGNYFDVEANYLNNGSSTVPNSTTSTVYGPANFLEVGGATSTLSVNCENTSHIDLNIIMTPSSTTSNLIWTYEFSYDNIDWFYEDGTTVASISAVTHSPGAVTHSWTPGSAVTSTKNIGITPVASRYCRVNFEVLEANTGLWVNLLNRTAY